MLIANAFSLPANGNLRLGEEDPYCHVRLFEEPILSERSLKLANAT
jgi:hypothetical protein